MKTIMKLAAACVLSASLFSTCLAENLELRSRLVSQVVGIESAEEIYRMLENLTEELGEELSELAAKSAV